VTARPGYERHGVTRELLVALTMSVLPRAFGAHLWRRSLTVITVADMVGDIVPRPDMLSS
jgi:hypothetical protein